MADEHETVTVAHPVDVRLAPRETKEEFAGELKMLAEVKLHELGKISSGKVAAVVGTERVSFLLSLGRCHVLVFNYTPEELEREVDGGQSARRLVGTIAGDRTTQIDYTGYAP